MIETNSLEIFKQNHYIKHDIGMVSNNAYLSIIATNKCQCRCAYCINGETDMSLDLPINKAIKNIALLVEKYGIKEAIILGGEPIMHPDILKLIRELRLYSGLEMIRLTTNGIRLKDDLCFTKELVDEKYGIQGLNISFHNEDFMTIDELSDLAFFIGLCNPNIKIRANVNIWKDNLDSYYSLTNHISILSDIVDEVRVSNIISKDSFSVNSVNKADELVLSDEEYITLFESLINKYDKTHTIIENKDTLGFVRYILIPTKCPIIINWNIGSHVADQVCENDIENRKINTFKCLVNGEISLSWNNNNVIKL